MTYAELGQLRGINTASAKRLASRRKWRRQPGNDGTARVAVPVDEAALSMLREQLERERSRADQATVAAERTAAELAREES
jgi:hypothetical protein